MACMPHPPLLARVCLVSLEPSHRCPNTDRPAVTGNLCGMAFPLFTQQMYDALTYHWANTLFALLAVFMAPIPYVGNPCSD